MKKMFTQKGINFKLAVVAFAAISLSSTASYGQTYYSRFFNPAGHYSKSDPSGCNAPALQNEVGIADQGDSSHAYIIDSSGSAPYTCSDSYHLTVDLNMNGGPNAVQPGNKAGFRIKIKPAVIADNLGQYLKLASYLRDSLNPNNVSNQEYAVAGGSSGNQFYYINLDGNSNGTSSNWFVYFITTKPFNLLELDINPKLIPAGSQNFEFDVYYAFGGALESVFPAQIANFKATVSGKNVNLSWQSLTETNVSSYRIERSSGNGSYTTVANVPAKGNSNAALSYAYSDKALTDGNYLYRIVTVNIDGTAKATNSLSAAISGQGKLLLYPTLVRAGQDVTVKTSETGLVNVYLFDATGRLVKQQRTTSSGQFTIPTAGLSKGVYNVKVVSAGGAVLQSKIVVN